VLTPDELAVERERLIAKVPEVIDLRQVKRVPEKQSVRMKELRDMGETLSNTREAIKEEFGDTWSIFTIEYHTNPEVRASILKSQQDKYYEGVAEGGKKLSDQASLYIREKQNLTYQLRAVGVPEEKIRELFESPEYTRRGRYKEAEESFMEMSDATKEIAKQANEYGDADLVNYRIADTNSISVNDAMNMKRQYEGAGMKHLADAIDLDKIKQIKKDNERDLKVGGWDRIGDSK